MVKQNLKQKAIQLRLNGLTYSEILKSVPVSKSTVSLWLREVGLSVPQKQRITEKRMQAQRKGAKAQKDKRIKRQADLIENAQREIGALSKKELWLIGIALYWAEGSKEKEYKPGSGLSFSNSDPNMIAVYLMWLKKCLHVKDEDLIFSIYIHELHKYRVQDVRIYWSDFLHKSVALFPNVYYKKNKINTNRKNTGDLYNGLLRVNIKASSNLNRKITGWIRGITENCGLV